MDRQGRLGAASLGKVWRGRVRLSAVFFDDTGGVRMTWMGVSILISLAVLCLIAAAGALGEKALRVILFYAGIIIACDAYVQVVKLLEGAG